MGRKQRHNRRKPLPANAIKLDANQIMQAMLAAQSAQAPQKDLNNQQITFTPGAPLFPSPGLVTPDGPRQMVFPLGYNVNQTPRTPELSSFQTLRNLANIYDGIMLCEQVWMDLCSRLDIAIKPYPKILEAAGGDETVFADDIAAYTEFFNYPDPTQDLDLKSWIRKALREQLELDALPIFVHPNRVGLPCALEIIDGSSIKPLIDDRGRRPVAPFPAFQQFWDGAPLGLYTSDEILYMIETPRADSMYGMSRVERVIMRVNQALRKQNKDLSLFTEGNLPQGVLEMPMLGVGEWTPDKMIEYQMVWDATLAGNDQTRSRLKVVLPGSKFTPIETMDVMTPFDMFVLNTTAACYGLTMAELGFTENVNKSSGDSQEDVIYRRAMRPLMNRYAELFTLIIRKYFRDDRFYVTWHGFEEVDDLETQANAYKTLVNSGLMDIAAANRAMGLPAPEEEIPRFVLTATGPIFFNQILDPQVLKAQKDAQMAGFEMAKNNSGGAKQQGKPGGSQQPHDEQNEPSSNDDKTKSQPDNKGADGHSRAIGAEYRRWRERAIADVKERRLQRGFTTTLIPSGLHTWISGELEQCYTVEQVKSVFARARVAEEVMMEVAV